MITKFEIDEIAKKYETEDFIKADPIQFPHRFKNKKDIEIAGFIASLVAYGARKVFNKKLESLFDIAQNEPLNFILNFEEKILGEADIRQIFKFSKIGNIAGSSVTDGVIKRDAKARVIRDGVVIYDGKIGSLQREKDSVKEVKKGYECGITIDGFNDIKVGDTIEAYEMVEVKK